MQGGSDRRTGNEMKKSIGVRLQISQLFTHIRKLKRYDGCELPVDTGGHEVSVVAWLSRMTWRKLSIYVIGKISVFNKHSVCLQWINRLIVHSNFIMQVVASHRSGRSYVSDGFAFQNGIAFF